MGDFFGRFWEFSFAVVTNWLWWVTTVPFFLDQLLSKNFWSKAAIRWLSERWPEEKRHSVFKWLAIAGFIVASFQAFDHVNSELKVARGQPNEISDLRAQIHDLTKHRWTPLSEIEIVNLRDALRKIEVPKKFAVFCNDADCARLQDSLVSSVKGLGWNEVDERSLDKIDDGIGIWTAHKEFESVAAAIEQATAGRLKVQFHVRKTGLPEMDDAISLGIGKKP